VYCLKNTLWDVYLPRAKSGFLILVFYRLTGTLLKNAEVLQNKKDTTTFFIPSGMSPDHQDDSLKSIPYPSRINFRIVNMY
jgi:hypothetical protein